MPAPRDIHNSAIDALLADLDRASVAIYSEVRSGSKLNPEQLRVLRVSRRRIAYVEEEHG